MAPEILSEQASEGPPLDIWGLGVILYYLMTGRHPFEMNILTNKLNDSKTIKRLIIKYNNSYIIIIYYIIYIK